ncbi:aldo/keto reductase [Roseisolibacter sp. H3M3-2]|uniref:aldo/keto reductase n=1 Tax=Roseisolibacter sp. H3M3-2 TaxID=3031323 RepID=UPI0023DC9DB5|nr:aldo/keto reductase [Roseisolibacter sp. H3M3-2]MDF1503452.1 aldo/keto reductase [Roseisolibacter sp. H3M3-2]
MIARREWLRLSLGAGTALALDPGLLRALQPPQPAKPGQLLTRAIPSTGERIPLVGLGSSATFSQVARGADVGAIRDVLRTLVEQGGRVFDTAPSYGASEEVAGRVARELGLTDRIFWATKVNVARGGGAADPAAARAQIETSFQRLGKRPLDLVQVHSLGDVPTQFGLLKTLKREGRVRYVGLTSTDERQYAELATLMRNEPIDFVGVDYAIDNREVEQTILPLAQERKVGVLVYAPFGRTRLWARAAGREVPAWAADFDARTWAQFFLKFVASHPAVTAITPATSRAANMADNIAGGVGRLPDAATRARMVALVDAWPKAGAGS